MNRKVYVANLPPQATEPELKVFSLKPGMSCLSRLSSTNKPASQEELPLLRCLPNGKVEELFSY